ncbi:MAG: HK97 gp10 family phage protein [Mesorhizobium sp.]|uniref:HK97-gp10 family putative phage morphogenesis protein n=1 Tax=Mesorhizobium sp. TaxID=1871066 RepID=UPI000FE56EB3|nr:HK97-gp10 family putative phage morphogenesis protein [Mesorhizobium sp.]RWD50567.1 MAG: HK97 gp10 family phage protein [Mesorhizobium sp.]RWE55781.1 MAG: HK97 gp10 family phage protein [Mesorhizobium sp.]RWF07318.1 MAG: HK97 gp10 family phage protein [Mesorhizobium sp.]RWF09686.1 MAG: HK97 gp10 family phage protein [Mesorhizobium sp.]
MAQSPQLARLQRRLEAIPKAVREATVPALVKSGEELAGTMRQLAEPSRDTGALIDSIAVTPPGQSTPPYSQPGGMRVAGELEVLVTAGNEDVRYAHLVEYGTSKAEAQPFFWPAFRLLQKRIRNRTKRAVSKAVRDGWNKP